MVTHGMESPTARIGVVRGSAPDPDATDVIAVVAPRVRPSLLRHAWRILATFERTWVTFMVADVAALTSVLVATLLTVTFRGEYAAQPMLIVAGVLVAVLVADVVGGLVVLWRRRRTGRA